MLRYTDPGGDIGYRMPSFGDLLHRFNPELFRVALATYDFSFYLSLRLRSVYWFRGDSAVRYDIFQTETTEPAVGQIQMHFLAQTSLGTDAVAIANDLHPDHQLGIN